MDSFQQAREMTEQFAKIAHDVWSQFFKHMVYQGAAHVDGSFTINADTVKRWDRQAHTEYEKLTESEKDSDRMIAKKYIDAMAHIMNSKVETCAACNGSGFYDRTDRKGRSIKCGACDGTGQVEFADPIPVMPAPAETILTDMTIDMAVDNAIVKDFYNGRPLARTFTFKEFIDYFKLMTSDVLKLESVELTSANKPEVGADPRRMRLRLKLYSRTPRGWYIKGEN